ncbi:Hypothetical protein SMAX5B_008227, partial [Scophthalmus maximus]
EQSSQGSRLEEGTQCVSTPSPAKVSFFWGMAALSSWLGRSSLLLTPSRRLSSPARNL